MTKKKKIANKAMNNEDYARHICCSGCNNYVCYTNKKRCRDLEDILTMAQWKDEQFAQEKQQWIEKAWNWLTEQKGERTIDDFKKAMKGE